MKTLSHAFFSIAFFFAVNKECTAQFQPTYDNHFGAEFNPTGEPMGGYCCYSQIIDPGDATYVVSTVDAFLCTLSVAQTGDIIYIDDNAWLDFTNVVDGDLIYGTQYDGGITIDVPNLTIASGRGRNCSNGATLAISNATIPADVFYTEAFGSSLFYVRARNFRLTGLRLDGPYNGRCKIRQYICVSTATHPNGSNPDGIEIDNCEIKSWNYTAILLNKVNNANIHHNFIHHSMYDGMGYGININKSKVIMEGNIFDYCRHAITGSGYIEGDWSYGLCSSQHINGTRYLIRYNMFLSHIYHSPIDIHNTCHYCAQSYPFPYESDCETTIDYSYACQIPNTGGEWLVIHHNSFYTDNWSIEDINNDKLRGITIGGYPRYGAIIFNNWFKLPDIPDDNPPPSYSPVRNDFRYISEELYDDCGNDAGYDFYYWTRSFLPPGLNYLPNPPYQTLLTFDNKFGNRNNCNPTIQQVWGTYANDDLYGNEDYRTGDFNNDGNLDLLKITSAGEFRINLSYDLTNPSEGIGYHTGSVWGQNGGPIDIERYRVADMNGDGLSDLVSFESNGGIYVWLNLGGIQFDSSPFSFAAYNGQSYASKYKIGDFNGDGNGDVIMFETDGGFYVWLSTGNSFNYAGSWGSQLSVTTPDRYKLGDLNGDGKTDVYYVSLSGNVNVWTSNGSSFGNVQIAYNGACMGDQYNAYKTGDINGDSYCDLLSFEHERIYVWVAGANSFLNSGNPQNWIYHDGTVHFNYIVGESCNSHGLEKRLDKSPISINDFMIYPNPSSGVFTLEVNKENNLEKSISVMDAVGSEVLRVEKSATTKTIIDLSSHPKGIYFIKVTEQGRTTVKKIVLI